MQRWVTDQIEYKRRKRTSTLELREKCRKYQHLRQRFGKMLKIIIRIKGSGLQI